MSESGIVGHLVPEKHNGSQEGAYRNCFDDLGKTEKDYFWKRGQEQKDLPHK